MSSFATITAGQDYEDRHDIGSGPITTPVRLTGLWMALFIIRPWEELIPELANIRFERLYALTVLSVVLGSGLFRFRGCTQTYAVLLFLTALAISTLFAYDPSLAWSAFYKYVTLVIFYFVVLSVIRTPYQLVFLITCYIVAMAAYLGKSQWEFFVHGKHGFTMGVSRMFGIETTFGNPNSVASSTVVSLPFLQFLWWYRQEITHSWPAFVRRWFPPFLMGYFLLAATSIMLTNSRAGAVGFTVFMLLFGRTQPRSRKMFRRFVIAVFALLALWVFTPETTKGRISTLWNPEAGPENARSSAYGRVESLWASWAMFSREPLTGVGMGNTAVYRNEFVDGVFLASHNLYGEVLGETGLIGTAAFAFLIASLLVNIRTTRDIAKRCLRPTTTMLADVATTCGYVIMLLLISGLAGDGMFRFQWLWLAAFALLARNFCESIAREEMESADL